MSNETSSASRSTSAIAAVIQWPALRVDLRRRPRAACSPKRRARAPIRRGRSRCRRARTSAPARTPTPPTIDGHLDDPVWRTAIPSDTFTQHYPDEGAAPSERTEVRVLYDDKNVYVGIDCEQIHSPIVRRLQRRDGSAPVGRRLDRHRQPRDGVSAFHFSINAAGVLSDGIHFNDTDFSSDWDAVWEAKVADTDRGYTVEFRIPLAVLRFSALPVAGLGLSGAALHRRPPGDRRLGVLPAQRRQRTCRSSAASTISSTSAPRHAFELRPFVLGQARATAAADADTTARRTARSRIASAGLDAKAHLTNELTLDLTVNPDFGQVEADTVILNLSTFETFFPEKRPFFLEGLDIFATIRPLLYTRRIGRQPPPPTLNAGEQLVAQPRPVRHLRRGQARRHDRRQDHRGPDLGGDRRERTLVQTADGTRVSRLVDPPTTFNVLRVKRHIAANADVGVLATATNRFEPELPAGAPLPGDAGVARRRRSLHQRRLRRQHRRALALGLGRLRGGLAGDRQRAVARAGAQPARRDPDRAWRHVAGGVSLYVGKEGGAHWLWNAWQHLTGPRARVQRPRLPRAQERLPGLLHPHLPDAPARGG